MNRKAVPSRMARMAVLVTTLAVGMFLPAPQAGAAAAAAGGRVIVLLDDSVTNPRAVAAEHARRHGADVTYVYEHAIKGYAATFPGTGASDVARDGRVRLVERDQVFTADAKPTPAPPSGVPWGLDRIDQREPALDGVYAYNATGAGATAYVIDTGILTTHTEFGGRAIVGYDACGGNGQDCNGHGTHVAGTIGGSTYGVAKAVTLVAVRVLNCRGSGTTSGVITGINYVIGHHAAPARAGTPAVANMSLGGGTSSVLNDAVSNSIAAGVSYAVAAGNGNRFGVAQDACQSSPAGVLEAMTIGATERTDATPRGRTSATASTGSRRESGSRRRGTRARRRRTRSRGRRWPPPHTAGVAALYLQNNWTASPEDVRAALAKRLRRGIVTLLDGQQPSAPNRLLNPGLFLKWRPRRAPQLFEGPDGAA